MTLSKREIEVLILITRGLRNREIAKDLDLSLKTIENHVSNIFRKLDAKNRTEAAVKAFKMKLKI